MGFERHGDIELTWFGNTLLVAPSGAVNEEGALAFNCKLERVTTAKPNLNGCPWHRIEFFPSKDTLFTPPVIELMKKSLEFSQQHNCQGVHVIGGNTLIKEIATRCCNEIRLNVRVFDTVDEWHNASEHGHICSETDRLLSAMRQIQARHSTAS